MGIEGVVLEDHGNITVFRRHIIHQKITDIYVTGSYLLQARNHPQGGGFPATGRSDKNNKLLIPHFQVGVVYRHHAIGKFFVDMIKNYFSHAISSIYHKFNKFSISISIILY